MRLFVLSGVLWGWQLCGPPAADGQDAAVNQVVIDLFVRPESQQCQRTQQFLEGLQSRRSGVELRVHDVIEDPQALAQLWKVARRFGHSRIGR